ncbi:MAG: DUF362 domain-containing protein [Chloroflexi bacterium]|nr:DUF362 domain-containing protein [Chloroflexota bacterium]
MIFPAAEFNFRPPSAVARARRVLIKPFAPYPIPYPATTSPDTLRQVIEAIRRVTDADILLVEGSSDGKPMAPIYKALGYEFRRVMCLDVRDSMWIEIDNPLIKPYALAAVWVPNVLLSCDFWISIAPFSIKSGTPMFSIYNLLGLLPAKKYRRDDLESLGMDKVIADVYFTLPFDMGIIDARQKLVVDGNPADARGEDVGKILMGEPFEIDSEAARLANLQPEFIDLIKAGKLELEG